MPSSLLPLHFHISYHVPMVTQHTAAPHETWLESEQGRPLLFLLTLEGKKSLVIQTEWGACAPPGLYSALSLPFKFIVWCTLKLT